MRTRRVGASDLEVSRLGLGTMTWGYDTPVSEAMALLKCFHEAGGTLVDTAAAYGHGEVERLLGRLFAKTVRRQEFVLATKSGYVLRDGVRVIDTTRRTLLQDLAGSLERLQTDYVDLWQIHAWGDTPIEETLAAADAAVAAGQARAVGVSNYIGWQLAATATWQRARAAAGVGDSATATPDLPPAPIAAVQVEYSLLARRAELEILPCCEALNVGFLPWSALGRGVLTGQYRTTTPPHSRAASDNLAWFVQPYLEGPSTGVVEAVVRAGHGLGLKPAQVALLWVRDAPGVTAPLIGPRTVAQLEPLLDIDDVELPVPIVQALDDVSGGPNALRPPVDPA
jgi:aryl-alcohol dehydrogenase-like predicted oxidoreductase